MRMALFVFGVLWLKLILFGYVVHFDVPLHWKQFHDGLHSKTTRVSAVRLQQVGDTAAALWTDF